MFLILCNDEVVCISSVTVSILTMYGFDDETGLSMAYELLLEHITSPVPSDIIEISEDKIKEAMDAVNAFREEPIHSPGDCHRIYPVEVCLYIYR